MITTTYSDIKNLAGFIEFNVPNQQPDLTVQYQPLRVSFKGAVVTTDGASKPFSLSQDFGVVTDAPSGTDALYALLSAVNPEIAKLFSNLFTTSLGVDATTVAVAVQ